MVREARANFLAGFFWGKFDFRGKILGPDRAELPVGPRRHFLVQNSGEA